ncbi:MAG: nodulation protein NfeD [Chitinophagaceae bacterium]|nr:nodulation protein NfeD [Chitinophagaceae bacterium]
MKSILFFLFLVHFLPAVTFGQKVLAIDLDGTINPASADFIHSAIEKAEKNNAECLIIRLNTPGGLLKSTRVIVSDLLVAQVPVIVYVSPAGAHAGSAGVFITLAANVAAMAPGTNIGAAHPVSMEGGMDSTMNSKATNDAAAFIRSIADKRNRNLEWAEDAVRNSVSITEREALEKNVIDIIATDEQDLLNQLDGRIIQLPFGKKELKTRGASVEAYSMSSWEKVLDIISDPSIAYILFLLGLFGIMFELYNPGAILPGIVGVISMILALYSMHSLPVNYAGLALIVFAIVLFLLELKIVSHGLLAIGGVVSLLIGSMMLIRASSGLELASISRTVIFSASVVTTLFFLFVVGIGLKAQQRRVVTGREALGGMMGIVMETLNPTGLIMLDGEIWNAESLSGTIKKGEKVKVREMKDLKVYVEKLNL